MATPSSAQKGAAAAGQKSFKPPKKSRSKQRRKRKDEKGVARAMDAGLRRKEERRERAREAADKRNDHIMLSEHAPLIFRAIDKDGSGRITKEEIR